MSREWKPGDVWKQVIAETLREFADPTPPKPDLGRPRALRGRDPMTWTVTYHAGDPTGPITHAEAAQLDNLTHALDGARLVGAPWRLRAALFEATATVLAALEGAGS